MPECNETLSLVSVVIPFFNAEPFVENFVKSLSLQTFDGFEVVAVNDGSTDKSSIILEKLLSSSGIPYKIINHAKNLGVSAARNTGLLAASGQFVCFIDVDDAISPEYLEKLLLSIIRANVGVCFARTSRDSNHRFSECTKEPRIADKYSFLREFLYRGNNFSVCAAIFRKASLEKHQAMFPQGYKYSEDVYFLWKLVAKEEKVAVLDHVLYHYYQNPLSVMHKEVGIERMDAILLMRKLEPYMAFHAPDFSKEFSDFAVARHYWSILWQAARSKSSYEEFAAFCLEFGMRAELEKMRNYPYFFESSTAKLFTISPLIYYQLVRLHAKFIAMLKR